MAALGEVVRVRRIPGPEELSMALDVELRLDLGLPCRPLLLLLSIPPLSFLLDDFSPLTFCKYFSALLSSAQAKFSNL